MSTTTDITYVRTKVFGSRDLAELFHSVGWEKDTPPKDLKTAMLNATRVIAACDGTKLVGLIRSMDDGVWSANIDCLVVHADYCGNGIGSALVSAMLDDLKNVMCISVSPNESANVGFYERFGFELVTDGRLLQKVKTVDT